MTILKLLESHRFHEIYEINKVLSGIRARERTSSQNSSSTHLFDISVITITVQNYYFYIEFEHDNKEVLKGDKRRMGSQKEKKNFQK